MQQNLILAALKLVVLTVLGVFMILSFIQTTWLEEKVIRTREKVDTLGENVAALSRKLDKATDAAEESRDASERSYERMNAMLDMMERVPMTTAPAKTDGNGAEPPPQKHVERADTKPQMVNGVKLYARNKGWTIICDSKADDDPDAAIQTDKVDWDATMRAVLTGEPPGLNYWGKDGNVTVETVWYYATDSLATRKKTNLREWKTQLAERVEESPDRTQYMIYLRKNVAWHKPALDLAEYPWLDKEFFVTARDVKFTIDMIRNPDAGSPNKYLFEDVETVEILDDHKLLVTWTRARFYNSLTLLGVMPMPEHIWAYDPNGQRYNPANMAAAFNSHWFGKNLCGNGPYRFVEYKPGQYIRYERFEDYYGQRATCKEQYRYIITDETQRLAKFLNKELDMHGLRAPQYKEYILEGVEGAKFRKYEDFDNPAPKDWQWTYFVYTAPVYGGFAWNMRRPILQDKTVRTALTYCLDRNTVAEKMQLGLAKVIAVGESEHSPYFPKDLEPLPFDIEKAKQLLDAAGWKVGGDGIREKMLGGVMTKLEVNVVLSAGSGMQRQMGQMYKNHLIEAGIRLKADYVDSALWSQRRNDRDFDGFIVFWYAGMDSNPQQIWESKRADEPNSSNFAGYKNPDADVIFTALETEWDYPKRIAMSRKWYGMQFEDQPYTWFCAFKSAIAMNPDWRCPKFRLSPRPYLDGRLIWKWKERP